jgi:hypothetical protein
MLAMTNPGVDPLLRNGYLSQSEGVVLAWVMW